MTPNNTDMFSRFIVDLFDERKSQGIPTAFQSFFGDPAYSETFFSEDEATFDQDIIRANGRPLAPGISRGQSSSIVGGTKNFTEEEYTNTTRLWPLIEQEGNQNSHQMLMRLPGETKGSGKSRIERNRTRAINKSGDMFRSMARTQELWAATSILQGKQPTRLGNTITTLEFDWKRNSTHTAAATVPWDNASSVPLDDLDGMADLIESDAYAMPNFVGLDDDTMAAFIRHAETKDFADNRRYDDMVRVGEKNPVPSEFSRQTAAGWVGQVSITTPRGRKLWLFTSKGRYTDANGDLQRYMTDATVFMLDTRARFDVGFGPRDQFAMTAPEKAWAQELLGFNMDAIVSQSVPNLSNVTIPQAFYFDVYPMGTNRKAVTLRSQIAPVYQTTQTDAIAVLTDTLT
jgi:hypothetical protein